MFLNFRARTYWLISLVLFLLAIGFVLLCIYSPGESNTIFIVLMTIDLILMTFAIQIAIQKSIKYRPKPEVFEGKRYQKTIDFDEALKLHGFTLRNRHIGRSYIKIEGKKAFKVVIINDSSTYFDNVEEPKDEQLSHRLDQCNRFTGLEIFINHDEKLNERVIDFSFQTDKVYYTALVRENDEYICKNYIEPSDKHKDNYNKLLNILGLNVIEEKTNGTNE